MSFGQEAEHAPVLLQAPKPSASIWSTILKALRWASGWPCGNNDKWVIFAEVNALENNDLPQCLKLVQVIEQEKLKQEEKQIKKKDPQPPQKQQWKGLAET